MFELDLSVKVWASISASGTPPSPRSGHGFTAVNGKLYVFGGFSDAGECLFGTALSLPSFSIYSRGSAFDQRLNATQYRICFRRACILSFRVKFARFCHTLLHVALPLRADYVDSDLFELDLATSTWEILGVNGTAPSPRKLHGFIPANGNLYVFGGWTRSAGVSWGRRIPSIVLS